MTVARIGDEVSTEEVAKLLKLNGELDSLLERIVVNKLMGCEGKIRRSKPAPNEIKQCAN